MSVTVSQRSTIVDRVIPRSTVADALLVLAGVALIAISAQVSIPMQPVPFTGQTFAVLLVGTVLGFKRGLLSVGSYVALGAAGLPIFTGGVSGFAFGPTLGYLIGFIASAAVTGFLAQIGFDKKWWQVALTFLAGTAAIYVFGLSWLSIYLGTVGAPNDFLSTASAGLIPFLLTDAIKAAAAAALLPLAWGAVNRISK